jgi:RNA polymerase sigma factor (sigma-70 family)
MTTDLDRHGGASEVPEALLRDGFGVIECVVGRVCRHAGLRDADADDFASVVNLALIEDDYAILRAWQQRSSLATYLMVVVRRLLCDERNRTRGRWEPSAESRRGGAAAILLETLVCRAGRSFEEAVPLVHAIDPTLSREDLAAILTRIPERSSRPRPSPLHDVDVKTLRSPDEADAGVRSREINRLSAEANRVVRRALASFSVQDQAILRFRFGSSMSVADIARTMRLPQRPLYRRLDALLRQLGRALIAAGIDMGTAESLIGSAVQALDFGLKAGNPRVSRRP